MKEFLSLWVIGTMMIAIIAGLGFLLYWLGQWLIPLVPIGVWQTVGIIVGFGFALAFIWSTEP